MSNPIKFRAGVNEDLFLIWNLIDKYKDRYQDDLAPVNPDVAKELLEAGLVATLTKDDEYGNAWPIGAVAFGNVVKGLRAEAHMLVRPDCLRAVLRSKVLEQVIDYVFLEGGLLKLKGVVTDGKRDGRSTQAVRVLKALGFRNAALLKNETYVNGEPADVYIFELTKPYWLRKRGLLHVNGE